MSQFSSNNNERKIKNNRKTINSLDIQEGDLKNSIIEYENAPLAERFPLQERGSLLLNDIIFKIENVISEIGKERLKKANLSSLGTTLKSLIQAYHFLSLHFALEDNQKLGVPDDPEAILEQSSEIVLRTKRKWDKGK